MTVNPIAPNQTEVRVNGNLIVLFSYKTPVACMLDNQYYRTEKKWSKTTSKYINKWLEGHKAEIKPQEYFDNLVDK